jgi:protoporphyrinogen oxidase
MKEYKHLIIGSGPAAMACAYELAKAGHKPVIFDTERQPGGICRTLNFQGYLFDIGGHRFLSKSKEVNKLWQDIMGGDLLRVKRLSRIYYKRKFFSYPLRFFDTFFKLGAWGSVKAVVSLLWCKYRKLGDLKTFDGWVIRNFGAELYKVFFKNYTEKVWGMPCANLSADWAMQRLRGLSLQVLIRNALSFLRQDRVKTLAEEFLYPRTGPGEFFRRLQAAIQELGGEFNWEQKVTGIKTEGGRVTGVTAEDLRTGRREEVAADFVFSTMPLPELARVLAPAAPAAVLAAAEKLKFRSFLAVNVILNVEKLFPDQWLYIQEPDVRLGRIQNYKNWSPAMVPDNGKTSLGLEYFCQEDDEFWNKSDIDLTDLAMSELEQIGIASRRHLIGGFVVRVPHAYPVYTLGYAEHVETLRSYLRRFENLATFGRGGLFQYDNSDHALLCGLYVARNFAQNGQSDVWNLNRDMGYLES